MPQIFRVAGALFDAQTGFNFIGGSSVDVSGVTGQPRTVSGSRDYHEFGDNRFSTKGHRYFIWAAAFIAPPSIKFWYPWFSLLSIGFQPDAHFHGDNRGFWNGASQPPSAGKNNFFDSKQSSRVWNAVLINTDPNLSYPAELNESGVGQTVVRYSDYGVQRTASGYATAPPPASVSVHNAPGSRNIDININANAGIPVIWGAPTIQYNYWIDIAQTPGHGDVISVNGYHTAFPWQELLIECVSCAAGHRDRILSSASAPFQYAPAPGANPLSLASMFIYWPGAVVLHP